MTAPESIQKRVKSFDYRGLADALADMRVLLDEIDRLQHQNGKLLAELKEAQSQ